MLTGKMVKWEKKHALTIVPKDETPFNANDYYSPQIYARITSELEKAQGLGYVLNARIAFITSGETGTIDSYITAPVTAWNGYTKPCTILRIQMDATDAYSGFRTTTVDEVVLMNANKAL